MAEPISDIQTLHGDQHPDLCHDSPERTCCVASVCQVGVSMSGGNQYVRWQSVCQVGAVMLPSSYSYTQAHDVQGKQNWSSLQTPSLSWPGGFINTSAASNSSKTSVDRPYVVDLRDDSSDSDATPEYVPSTPMNQRIPILVPCTPKKKCCRRMLHDDGGCCVGGRKARKLLFSSADESSFDDDNK